jgi:hypothetical protein
MLVCLNGLFAKNVTLNFFLYVTFETHENVNPVNFPCSNSFHFAIPLDFPACQYFPSAFTKR